MAVIDYFDKKAILKQRFRKTYRHATLDQKLLTKRITQVTTLHKLYYKINYIFYRKLGAWLELTSQESVVL